MMPPDDLLNVHASDELTSLATVKLNDKLAEAARYAVLNRVMPVLRHDAAGAMQPVRMLLMVLEKRLQAADPDLHAITQNVASISTLSKQAGASCLDALGWLASTGDSQVSLRSSVDAAAALLAVELNGSGLELINSIDDETVWASQTFLRSSFIGALLAFCDQHSGGGNLQTTFKPASTGSSLTGQLRLHLQAKPQQPLHLLGEAAVRSEMIPRVAPQARLIDWADVQAMAQSSSVGMARGDGWVTFELPNFN